MKYVLDFSDKEKDDFIAKLSDISLDTDIYLEVIKDPDFLIDGNLDAYLKNEHTSSAKRFEKICRAVERDRNLLNLSTEDICKKAGLTFYPRISNKDKAALINAISILTDSPVSLKESDIKSLKNTEEVFWPAFHSLIHFDVNMVKDAKRGLDEDQLLEEGKLFRTMFIYNNPESPQKDNHFGFYSFSKKRHIISGSLEIGQKSLQLLSQDITKVLDTASFDFDKAEIKPERSFFHSDIIWHKSYSDIIPFLEMAEKMNLTIEKNSFAFTDNHRLRFYLFRIKGKKTLHITIGYSFIESELTKVKFPVIPTDFYKIIEGKEKHLNNFCHDIVGVAYPLNMVEMPKDDKGWLEYARNYIKNGLPKDHYCICGSNKRYKNCHGYKIK